MNSDKKISGPERRLKPRYASNIKVEMMTKGLNHFTVERCANISTGGIFVCTDYAGEMNERVHVRIILSDKDSYFDVKTRVAWICDGKESHPKGLGLEFTELSEQQSVVVQKILKEYVNIQE